MAKYSWKRFNTPETDNVVYYADREDGTEMTVTKHPDDSITVFVVAPDGESEFLMGELEERTVNDGIGMAEEVVLPDDDTGI